MGIERKCIVCDKPIEGPNTFYHHTECENILKSAEEECGTNSALDSYQAVQLARRLWLAAHPVAGLGGKHATPNLKRYHEWHWQLIFRAKGGHSYFYQLDDMGDPTEKVAVADQSGQYPHLTDNGVLFLDMKRHIIGSCETGTNFDIRFSVPVLNANDSEYHTGATLEEAIELMLRFNFTLKVGKRTFSIHEVRP